MMAGSIGYLGPVPIGKQVAAELDNEMLQRQSGEQQQDNMDTIQRLEEEKDAIQDQRPTIIEQNMRLKTQLDERR